MDEPSQRKTSISTLVYSTLGPSLGLLPSEEKGDWVVMSSGSSEPAGAAEAEPNVDSPRSRPPAHGQHTSVTSETDTIFEEAEEAEKPGSSDLDSNSASNDTGIVLSRLYTSPASSSTSLAGQKTRLAFASKSGAGSMSSMEQATPTKRSSVTTTEDGMLSPESPITKQLHSTSSAAEMSASIGEEFKVHRSVSNSGFIPRAPTGTDRSRSDRESVGLVEMLKDLDRQAGEKQHRERVSSLQRDSAVGRPISWQEDAISNRHLWQSVDSREACHLADTQYCQQLKLFHPRRQKLRCSACKTLVHDTCVKQLYYEGYCCKHTFREIKQKVKETTCYHHFLQRRKAIGKCIKCDRGFGNWRKFNLRDVVGVSCSWCLDSFHVGCFSESLRQQPCHMGPLRNLIIPPSWIVRVPPVEQLATTDAAAHVSPKNSTRRKTRRSRRRRTDERASKYFTVKPIVSRQHKPLIVFINPKSGGNQGAKLLHTFQWLLNPRQVFDLSQGGPEFGLKMFQGVSNLRILACGGDGTAGWIFSVLDKLDIRPTPPLAILPLGTGNDLARVFGWGGGYTDEPIEKILLHVEEGPVEIMDRWQLNVWPYDQGQQDPDGVEDTPLHVINNYFSIGADAQVSLEFHLDREANPEKFSSRYKNKMQYTKLSGKDLFLRRFQTMTDHITLFVDGEDFTDKIRALRLEAICFLNISSYGSGFNAWGNPSSRDRNFRPQKMDDGKIEIVGFWASTFPKLVMGLAHGERIAHCEHIKMITHKAFPVQIDGEAVKLQPSVIEVGLKNKASLVRKVARIHPEAPLQGVRPSDRIKLSVSKVTSDQYDRLHSDLVEIKKTAKALGLVVATAQDTLRNVRKQIEHFTYEVDEDEENHLSKNWRYLDVANSGRVDRMFQVTPDQERTMLIGDMLSDGLLVVELSPSPPCTPASGVPAVLLSPEKEPVARELSNAEEKRKMFGRNASYEIATTDQCIKGLTPPPSDGSPGPEAAAKTNLGTESDTPVPSEEEEASSSLPLPLPLVDTGSDSGATDSDMSSQPALQKAFLDSVKRGNLRKVIAYYSKGANLLETDHNGWTPLHHAARLDKKEVVQYIVEHIPKEGLDLVEDEKIQTALHKAAWYGHLEVCKILVEKGASLNRRDYQGNDVHDKSIQSGNKELEAYIQDKVNAGKHLSSGEMAI